MNVYLLCIQEFNLRHIYFVTGHLRVGSAGEYFIFENHKIMYVGRRVKIRFGGGP